MLKRFRQRRDKNAAADSDSQPAAISSDFSANWTASDSIENHGNEDQSDFQQRGRVLSKKSVRVLPAALQMAQSPRRASKQHLSRFGYVEELSLSSHEIATDKEILDKLLIDDDDVKERRIRTELELERKRARKESRLPRLRTIRFEELPTFLQDNEWIRSGYVVFFHYH